MEPLPKLPLLSQMITAVTPQPPLLQPLQSSSVGEAVGPLTRSLNNLHLSQDPEVLLDALEEPDTQLDGMMVDE